MLGEFDSGKSWLLNELSGNNEFASGYSQRTKGLYICYPKKEGNYVEFIDTPGSKEAVRVTDPDLA